MAKLVSKIKKALGVEEEVKEVPKATPVGFDPNLPENKQRHLR